MERYTAADNFHSYQQSFYPDKIDCFMPPDIKFQAASRLPDIPQLDFLDAMLHGNSFGMELVNDGIDSWTGDSPVGLSTGEKEFADLSDINFEFTPTNNQCVEYTNNQCVKYPDINYFDILDEDIQRFKEINKELERNLSNLPLISYIQEQLQGQKIKLLLLTTSSDNDKVAEELKRGLEVEENKMIPFANNDTSSEGMYDLQESRCSLLSEQANVRVLEFEVADKGNNLQTLKQSRLKRVREEEKDERYWKQRMKNNAAAKKSRAARKNRVAFMEQRIKELEVENTEKKEFLKYLTTKYQNIEISKCLC